jgi:hypothetical protein
MNDWKLYVALACFGFFLLAGGKKKRKKKKSGGKGFLIAMIAGAVLAVAGGGGTAATVVKTITAPHVRPGSNVAIGQQLAAYYGWGAGLQWSCLYLLWDHESGWIIQWNHAGSGAYGIPQALPASKMASAGADYMTNPATQIRWGLGYIKSVYGTPCNAWSTWQARSPHWY